jgi:hypothetical protein
VSRIVRQMTSINAPAERLLLFPCAILLAMTVLRHDLGASENVFRITVVFQHVREKGVTWWDADELNIRSERPSNGE